MTNATDKFLDLEEGLPALWADIDQRCSELVSSAAQDISDEAVQLAQDAADDSIREAIDAVTDISELSVPTMSPSVKGGAFLGDGLSVEDGTLSATTRIETRQSGSDTYQVLVIG